MRISHTIEEYSLPDNEYRLVTPDGIVDTIEVDLDIDYEPSEPPDDINPGCAAQATLTAVTVKEVVVVDGDGTEIDSIHNDLFCGLVANWLALYWAEEQYEWACEQAEEWLIAQHEAAMEAKADRDEARRKGL